MAACPVCFGEGQHDMRDEDAQFAEHFSDATLASWERRGFVRRCGIVPCDECEGTGVVSEERWLDLRAAARAWVSQAQALLDERDSAAAILDVRLHERRQGGAR